MPYSSYDPPFPIREARVARGITQQELADRTGTTRAVIAMLEHGHRSCSDKWLRRIAVALGTTPGTLADGRSPANEEFAGLVDRLVTSWRESNPELVARPVPETAATGIVGGWAKSLAFWFGYGAAKAVVGECAQ